MITSHLFLSSNLDQIYHHLMSEILLRSSWLISPFPPVICPQHADRPIASQNIIPFCSTLPWCLLSQSCDQVSVFPSEVQPSYSLTPLPPLHWAPACWSHCRQARLRACLLLASFSPHLSHVVRWSWLLLGELTVTLWEMLWISWHHFGSLK